ncbi:MAG: hypothetical protein RIS82_854 [Actinomycetota bacterium]|jgi:hypothetical protein
MKKQHPVDAVFAFGVVGENTHSGPQFLGRGSSPTRGTNVETASSDAVFAFGVVGCAA